MLMGTWTVFSLGKPAGQAGDWGCGLGLWFGAGFGAVVLGFWFWSVVCSVDLGSMVLGSVDFGSVDFGPYFWSVVLGL